MNGLANANYSRALRHAAWTDLFNTGNYFWQLSFRSIDLANQVLDALDRIDVPNARIAADKKRLEGEARFLRGMAYFALHRFFAQPANGLSLPILSRPFRPGDQPARATIPEMEAFIIADLTAAGSLLEDTPDNKGRATGWAAIGMLARVQLEFEDYPAAEALAARLIDNGPFSLADGQVAAAFSPNISSENIFTFLAKPIDRAADNLFSIFSLNSNNVQLSVSDEFWATISQNPDDLRLTVLHQDFGTARACHKYNDRNMNIPYIRLPEMFLIRAEARTRNGNTGGGLADLNRLRQRAGLPPTSCSDPSELLDKILADRSLELSMEGDNFHTLKRLQQPIGGFPWAEARFKLVFFIPEKEIRLNPNLIQNDTW